MALSATFKQAVFKTAGGPLVVEEVPLVQPSANQLLVKVEACGVCFSDQMAQHNMMGAGLYVVVG